MSDTIFDLFRAEGEVARALLDVIGKAPALTIKEMVTLSNALGLEILFTVQKKQAPKTDGGA